MDQIRTFIAVRIPDEVRQALARVESKLMASGADVKWVPEGNFHVTLKFLGNVPSDRIDAVSRAVESAVGGLTPFDVALTGVGAFPKPSRPNVVWVGTSEGGDRLVDLAARVENALEPLGFAREKRAFSPHITIGRTKSLKCVDSLRNLIDQLGAEHIGAFKVETVVVMKSDLRPAGPLYSALAELKLC